MTSRKTKESYSPVGSEDEESVEIPTNIIKTKVYWSNWNYLSVGVALALLAVLVIGYINYVTYQDQLLALKTQALATSAAVTTLNNFITALTNGSQGIQGLNGTQGIQGIQGVQGLPGPALLNNVTQYISATHQIYVNYGGDDTTGTGTILQPFRTIQKALANVSGATTTNRWAIYVGPGRFDETGDIKLVPWVWMVGTGRSSTRITSSTNNLLLDDSFATGNFRAGLLNVLVSGSTIVNFDLQSIGGSGSTVIEILTCDINNAFRYAARTTADFVESKGNQYLSSVTLIAGSFEFSLCYIVGALTLTDIGSTSSGAGQNGNLAAFKFTKMEGAILLNRTKDLVWSTEFSADTNYVSLTAQTITPTLNGNMAIQMTSDSVPPVRTLINPSYITLSIQSFNGQFTNKEGKVQLNSLGAANVTDSFVTVVSGIHLMAQEGTPQTGFWQITSRQAGAWFYINSTSGNANVNVSYWIVNPA